MRREGCGVGLKGWLGGLVRRAGLEGGLGELDIWVVTEVLSEVLFWTFGQEG